MSHKKERIPSFSTGGLHKVMYYLYKIAQFIALRLPLKIGYAMAGFIAILYYTFSANDKKALRNNIKTILKEKVDDKECERIAKEVFINFAKYLVDFFRFSKIDNDFIKKNVDIEGRGNVEEVLKKNKGAIMVSSHLGNWELGGAIISLIGYPLYAIVLGHDERRVNDFFIGQRAMGGVTSIPIGAGLKRCFKVLKENKILAILGDRAFTEGGEKIKFFDKEALMPKGPAVFSLRTNAAIIPTFFIRQKSDRFKLIFGKPTEFEPTGNEKEDIRNLMSAYIRVIEDYIKQYPDQWYVFRNVWSSA